MYMHGKGIWHEYYLNVVSMDDEPVMTNEERLAAICKEYAVLNNRTSGSILELFNTINNRLKFLIKNSVKQWHLQTFRKNTYIAGGWFGRLYMSVYN